MKIDSDLTLAESLSGSNAPENIIEKIVLINVNYIGFDEQEHQGQILIHKDLKEEVENIFEEFRNIKFPIEKVIPIVKYGWDDQRSMLDNNSSAFNYRHVHNKNELSNHSFGRAIDINPRQNPYIDKEGKFYPLDSSYNSTAKGTILTNEQVVKIFSKYGWEWGGDWGQTRGYFDYQHFQKN